MFPFACQSIIYLKDTMKEGSVLLYDSDVLYIEFIQRFCIISIKAITKNLCQLNYICKAIYKNHLLIKNEPLNLTASTMINMTESSL